MSGLARESAFVKRQTRRAAPPLVPEIRLHLADEAMDLWQATEADLAAFLRERLGPVQTPKRIHFMSELPRSPVGKVLKNAVRDLAIASGSNT